MNKKSKIYSSILIIILIFSFISTLTTQLASNLSVSKPSIDSTKEESFKSPETSDLSGTYDLGDGNTMNIDAIDNTTTTTLYNNIDGVYGTLKSEKNDTYASTIINDTASIICNSKTGISLKSGGTDIYLPSAHQLDIYNSIDNTETYTNATVSDIDTSLDSFYANNVNTIDGSYFNMSYIKDDVDGYDLDLLMGIGAGSPIKPKFNYDNEINEFKWRDNTYDLIPAPYFSDYRINTTGVWKDTSQVIDWTTPNLQTYTYKYQFMTTYFYQINISKYYDTIIIHYSRLDFIMDFYELIFTKAYDDIITMKFNLLAGGGAFQWSQNVISKYFNPTFEGDLNSLIMTFYIWDITDLLYNFIFEGAPSLEFSFLTNRTLILWGNGPSMELQFSEELSLFTIIFVWYGWNFKIDILLNILLKTYLSYVIYLTYYIWLYVYLVPTVILPNFLTITIIESIYTAFWFYIKISVRGPVGYPRPGATITGTWDGSPIGAVTDRGDGTYNFTIPAKYVLPGEDPLWLNLTAISDGYAAGILNTEIAVEQSKKLIINIIESIYNEDIFELKVEIRNCTGDLVIGTILAGVWNNIGLTTQNITDNGDGTFDLTLTPCFVLEGDDPIWLNLTASKVGYVTGILNTLIAVEAPIIVLFDILSVDIVDLFFSAEDFNITLYIYNASNYNQGVSGANLNIWWNGTLIDPTNITDHGNGNYTISIDPISVTPSSNPIKLNGIITASGFVPKTFEMNIRVDPEIINKGKVVPPGGGDDDGGGGAGKEEQIVSGPSIILISIISVIAVTSIAFNLIKRRRKY